MESDNVWGESGGYVLILWRSAGVAGLTALTVLGLASPAHADIDNPVDCAQNPATCNVTVTTPGGTGDPGTSSSATCQDLGGRAVPCYVPRKGWYGGDGCWYQLATGDDLATVVAVGGTPTPPAQWYVGSCGNPAENYWPITIFKLFANGPAVDLLAQEAEKALRMPSPLIRINPSPPAAQLVRVPTWMWVDSSTWGIRMATASAGGVSVTATATAKSVTWATGDGATVTCRGPGQVWAPDDDPARSSSCSHTYSAAGSYRLTATVTWEISWAGGGQTGTVPALTTTASIAVRVQEAGALNTNGV